MENLFILFFTKAWISRLTQDSRFGNLVMVITYLLDDKHAPLIFLKKSTVAPLRSFRSGLSSFSNGVEKNNLWV